MQDSSPNQEQVHSQKLLDCKTGIEEEDQSSSRGRSLSPSCVRASKSLATVHDLPRWCTAPTSALVPAAQTLPEHHPDPWHSPRAAARSVQVGISSPSSAGRSPHAGPGFGSVPSPPRSCHRHRPGHTGQGELCRALRDGQAPPHLPGSFPGTRHPGGRIQKPLAPDANASPSGYRRLIPALAASSCSWDRDPGKSPGRTETRELQHRRGCAGSPGEGQLSPSIRSAIPDTAHRGTPRFPKQPQGHAPACKTGKEGRKTRGSRTRLQNSRSPLQTVK